LRAEHGTQISSRAMRDLLVSARVYTDTDDAPSIAAISKAMRRCDARAVRGLRGDRTSAGACFPLDLCKLKFILGINTPATVEQNYQDTSNPYAYFAINSNRDNLWRQSENENILPYFSA
jgi:hypothetical protein